MLISRGFELKYKTETTAQAAAIYGGVPIDSVHPGCNCTVEAVYSWRQYNGDPRFDMNRLYRKLWPIVTEGYGGQDALNAWRRWIERPELHSTPKIEAVLAAAA